MLDENGKCDEKEEQWCLHVEKVDIYVLDPATNRSHEVKIEKKKKKSELE